MAVLKELQQLLVAAHYTFPAKTLLIEQDETVFITNNNGALSVPNYHFLIWINVRIMLLWSAEEHL